MSEIIKIGAIASGAIIGALSRYYLVLLIDSWHQSNLSLGVLTINCLGSFLITLIAGYLNHHSDLPRYVLVFFTVGMLGSFTTFSTFSMDNLKLVQNGQTLLAIVYSLLSVCGGLLCAWAGYLLSRWLVR